MQQGFVIGDRPRSAWSDRKQLLGKFNATSNRPDMFGHDTYVSAFPCPKNENVTHRWDKGQRAELNFVDLDEIIAAYVPKRTPSRRRS